MSKCNCKKEWFDSEGNCFPHSKVWTEEQAPIKPKQKKKKFEIIFLPKDKKTAILWAENEIKEWKKFIKKLKE